MILNPRRTRGCATSQTTLLAIALLTFMGAGALWSVSGKAPKHQAAQFTAQAPAALPASVKAHALASAAKLPLSFEPNQGQADPKTSYIAHGSGYGLSLTANEAILALNSASKAGTTNAAVHMQLEGASASPKITAADPLPGKTNYFIGNDASRWVRNVPNFARVQYAAVYPGIDLVYYGQQGQLEYDFVVGAGANPSQIRLNIAGAEKVSLGADGSLRLKTPVRELRWNKPVVYQEVNGQRQPVAGRFELLAKNRVGFALGQYDRTRELIIDPTLAYTTYFGGTGNEINPQVAVDPNSNIYLAGTTSSAASFPGPPCGAAPLPPCPVVKGADAVFISKLNPFASAVLYTTFLSSSGVDSSSGLAVDNAGNAYVTGTTVSNSSVPADFPVSATAFQSAPLARGAHVFLSKLDPTGATLLYSSYLSGTQTDTAYALAADNSGNAYILGNTLSVADFPTTLSSFQPAVFGATDVFFFAKFNTAATSGVTSLVAASYLAGGTSSSNPATPPNGVVCSLLPCGGIALDTTGNAYVAVGTTFTNLAVTNAFQNSLHGPGTSDAYVAKIKSDGTALLYSTYIGGSANDVANAIALDSSGNAYITGSTFSTDFPVGVTLGRPFLALTSQDAFVAKLNNPTSGAVSLTYSSDLGGSLTDMGLAIVADSAQNAYVTGSTTSTDFPLVPAGGTAPAGTNAFLSKLSTITASTATLVSSVYLGGSGNDRGTSLVQNNNGAVYVTGETNSTDFPVAGSGRLQALLNTTGAGPNNDAFVATYGPTTDLSLKVTPCLPPTTLCPAGTAITRVGVGNATTFTFTVTNLGPDASTGAQVQIPVPLTSTGVSTATFTTTSGSCAITGTGGSQVETCTLATLANLATATIVATITPTPTSTGIFPASISMGGTVFPGNSAVDPITNNNSITSGPVYVDSFKVVAAPVTFTLTAGKTASSTLTLTAVSTAPTGSPQFPGNITLACTLPTTPIALTGATCTFTPNPVKTIPVGTGSTTSSLMITTTAPTKTGAIWKAPTIWYALWLPISGLALLGTGSSRRRRWISGMGLVTLLFGIALLPGCGSKSKATTTTGTQPGAYTIGLTATSGTYSQTLSSIGLTITP